MLREEERIGSLDEEGSCVTKTFLVKQSVTIPLAEVIVVFVLFVVFVVSSLVV